MKIWTKFTASLVADCKIMRRKYTPTVAKLPSYWNVIQTATKGFLNLYWTDIKTVVANRG